MSRSNTRIIPADAAGIAEAAALIRAGACVAVPTETVYGLAADATDAAAVAGIYAAKGRPAFNPLIVHVADMGMAEELAQFDAAARALAARYWPGPLTLVLPHRGTLPAIVTAGLPTVALRMPAHPAMRALIAAVGRPLAAPSANLSGTISPTRAAHVMKTLAGRIPLILDAGATAAGLESTIVKVADGCTRLLRPGPIGADELSAVVPDGPAAVEAPGQLSSHYAPHKPLRLDAETALPDEYLIGFGAVAGDATLSADGNLVEAAARLFDLLHQADESDRARIAVAPVPAKGLGLAIRDRLARAAHRG
ncbi:threonylcarbamoyl-AMP synthase [Sphingomonas changnyeongensis]|uniref:Threonylcarbamoyl-AMP synthase n=1 Tax=Sphingomonas changnyeongensis TaxID=2698679 RepID=A0A7Z2NXE1_9SPHN|nr:L-threonylcarbamoyladenylate synthase [Sphingomonas changnyeongensis]QHL91105.1 threonylcarbamoyl-AMP synthase [Sphingomonas changnyeongensis]